MLVSRKKLLVEWGHCDPAGIVFFPQYLAWFDDCTTALFLHAGMPIQTLFKQHGVIGFPIVDLRTRFILPSKFGDELIAESTVTKFGKSSFVVRHQISKAGALAVEGFATRVWTAPDPNDPSKMKSRPLPKEVIDRLSAANPAADPKRSK
jgi:4-hydroxybenzoyl-CoA thioesterase